MLEILKKLMTLAGLRAPRGLCEGIALTGTHLFSLIEKIKCNLSCCNSNINIRILEKSKTISNEKLN